MAEPMAEPSTMSLFTAPYKPACVNNPPDLGVLPAEQWLLRNWNIDSSEAPADQLARLMKKFLELPVIPRELWDGRNFRSLSTIGKAKVLQPWRSEEIRGVANALWTTQNNYPPMLRSYYEPGNLDHDLLMKHWISMGDHINPYNDWIVIDDPAYFPGGIEQMADWKNVYMTLPELAGPEHVVSDNLDATRWLEIPPWAKFRLDLFKIQLAINKLLNPELWHKDKAAMIESCAGHIHRAVTHRPLILIDKQAFDTGYPLLMYLDHWGNVVRQTRFDLTEENLLQIFEDWLPPSFTTEDNTELNHWMWYESEVGENYKVQNPNNVSLYQLTTVDLEDPEDDLMHGTFIEHGGNVVDYGTLIVE